MMQMARTTINLNDTVFKKLKAVAKQENRSAPNLIETIVLRYLDEEFYVDEFEMDEIRRDSLLKRQIQKSLAAYKKGRGEFV